MKKIIIFILPFALGCNHDETPDSTDVKVTYEVVTTSGKWSGEYIEETGKKICLCNQQFPIADSGWKYSFKVHQKPFTLHVDAETALCCPAQPQAPDVTTNIYVDSILVVTHTSNWAKGVASADYVIK